MVYYDVFLKLLCDFELCDFFSVGFLVRGYQTLSQLKKQAMPEGPFHCGILKVGAVNATCSRCCDTCRSIVEKEESV